MEILECKKCRREMPEQDSTANIGQAGEPAIEAASHTEEASGPPIPPSVSEGGVPPSPSTTIPDMITRAASVIPLPTVGRARSHNPTRDALRAARPLPLGLMGWGTFLSKVFSGSSPKGGCVQATERDNPKTGSWGKWLHRRRRPPGDGTWTMRQAFFVVAGGLAVDSKSFWGEPYLTFTPAGVVELARLGFMPEVTVEIVEDKSKTDSLGKILVFFQAGWFITQAIARTVQGLPQSLLEVHVLAHVAVAFAMYLFWFKKPYSALSPIVLTDPEVVELAALFALGQQAIKSTDSDADSLALKCCQKDNVRMPHVLSAYIDRHASNIEILLSSLKNHELKEKSKPAISGGNREELQSNSEVGSPLRRNQTQDGQQHSRAAGFDEIPLRQVKSEGSQPNEGSASAIEAMHLASNLSRGLSTDSEGIFEEFLGQQEYKDRRDRKHPKPDEHLRLAQKAVERLKTQGSHFVWSSVSREGLLKLRNRDIYTVADCSDFHTSGGFIFSRESFWNKPSLKTLLQPTNTVWKFLIPLFILYGAFHLCAWNAHFPTPLERWMWRGAGLAILSIPALYLALFIAATAASVALSIVFVVVIIAVGLPVVLLLEIPWSKPVFEKWKKAIKPRVSITFKAFKTSTKKVLKPAMVGILAFIVFVFVVIAYLLIILAFAGRGYFLIEAIIGLRSPEAGTYNTTAWINFLPHG